ncbi:MAG: hypothetical protein ACOVQY_07210 [Erythrobacter sp.]
MMNKHASTQAISPAGPRPIAQASAARDDGHAALIGMTVPLMAHSWQHDRIVLGEKIRPTLSAGLAQRGMIAIDLSHAAEPMLALVAPGRIALAYDPAAPAAARPAVLAAAALGGWPIAGDTQSMALLALGKDPAAIPREPLSRAQSITLWLARSVAPEHPLHASLVTFYGGLASQISANIRRARHDEIAQVRGDLNDLLAAAG